jgi:hypothetical protein
MPNASYSLILAAGDAKIDQNSQVLGDTPNPLTVDIPAAKAGTLTTRTDDDTGVITLAASHGIGTSDTVDLYSATTGELLRKDVDVTSADSTTIGINAGTGSNLPADESPIIVCKQRPFLPTILPATIQILGVQLKIPGDTVTKGRVAFSTAAPVVAADMSLVAGQGQIFNVAGGESNPLGADAIVSGVLSHANTTLAAQLQIISVEDRTP